MQNQIICEIGPKGSGKTHDVCNEVRTNMDRVVIFDMLHEQAYAEAIGLNDENPDPNNIIIEGNPRALVTAIKDTSKAEFKVVYRPTVFEPKPNNVIEVPEFGPVTNVVYTRGDCWFVIDEAHILTDSYTCPRELMIANLFGRHRRMSMLFVSQSFTGIHPKIRRNADEFRFWRIIEPSDLEAIRKRCGKDVEEQVTKLRVLKRNRETDELIQTGQMLKWDKLEGIVGISE